MWVLRQPRPAHQLEKIASVPSLSHTSVWQKSTWGAFIRGRSIGDNTNNRRCRLIGRTFSLPFSIRTKQSECHQISILPFQVTSSRRVYFNPCQKPVGWKKTHLFRVDPCSGSDTCSRHCVVSILRREVCSSCVPLLSQPERWRWLSPFKVDNKSQPKETKFEEICPLLNFFRWLL